MKIHSTLLALTITVSTAFATLGPDEEWDPPQNPTGEPTFEEYVEERIDTQDAMQEALYWATDPEEIEDLGNGILDIQDELDRLFPPVDDTQTVPENAV